MWKRANECCEKTEYIWYFLQSVCCRSWRENVRRLSETVIFIYWIRKMPQFRLGLKSSIWPNGWKTWPGSVCRVVETTSERGIYLRNWLTAENGNSLLIKWTNAAIWGFFCLIHIRNCWRNRQRFPGWRDCICSGPQEKIRIWKNIAGTTGLLWGCRGNCWEKWIR